MRAFCGILSNQQPRNYRPHAISLENQISLLSARIFVFLLAAHCTKIRKKCYLVGKYKINFFIDISSIGAPAKCKRVKRGKNKKVDFSHWGNHANWKHCLTHFPKRRRKTLATSLIKLLLSLISMKKITFYTEILNSNFSLMKKECK